MTFWKPALLGAVLAVAGCNPVGVPLGEERLAERIADNILTDEIIGDIMRQQVQGLMYQGSVSQDQVSQVAMAINRELDTKMPEVKATMVQSLTSEFNIKELEFLHELLTSDRARKVMEGQQAAMQAPMEQLDGLAREAATRAVARVNSAWPTGANPAPAPPPEQAGPQLPPGLVPPNN